MAALIKKVVVATDFSSCADHAQDYAFALASAWGGSLDILHVVEFQPGMDVEFPVNQMYLDHRKAEAGPLLQSAKERASRAGLSAQTHLRVGVPSEEIKAFVRSSGADLVVLGTHGRTGLEHVLLGSTAERIVRIAPCPVLSVKAAQPEASEEKPPAAGVRMGKIVVPIDFSDCSLDALEFAVQFNKPFGAAITLLHVMEPVAYGLDFTLVPPREWKLQKERVAARLEELATALTVSGVTADHVLRSGLPSDSIIGFVRERGFDLVIMGTHGRRGLSHLLSGSVAGAMLRLAPCPVLTVHSPKFGPEHRRVVAKQIQQPVTN
jgi:nucleotide-binding universal stress UspA family protein